MEWEYNVLVTMPDGKEEKYFHKHPGKEKLAKREAFPLGGGRYVAVTEIVKEPLSRRRRGIVRPGSQSRVDRSLEVDTGHIRHDNRTGTREPARTAIHAD